MPASISIANSVKAESIFPASAVLRKNNYQGWITLDFDEPRPGEGSVEENLTRYKKYLREKLKVNF